MNNIFYLLFIISIPLFSQMKFEFDGQLMGQSNFNTSKNNTSFIGTRYLPVLNLILKVIASYLPFLLRFQGI